MQSKQWLPVLADRTDKGGRTAPLLAAFLRLHYALVRLYGRATVGRA